MTNRKYLAFIRSMPSAVSSSRRNIEACHTGPHGLGQKSSDFSAIPLTAQEHRLGPNSYHKLGARKFAELHSLDIPALVAKLNTIGLRGLKLHSFGKREPSPGFTRFHCSCGFRTVWYRREPDARAALHNHIVASQLPDHLAIPLSL